MAVVLRTYQERVYLTKAVHKRFDELCGLQCELYNAGLEAWKWAYKMAGVSIRYRDLDNELTGVRKDDPRYADIARRLECGTLRRLERAQKSFFRRVKNGEKPGYPRFKPRSRWRTLEVDAGRPEYLNGNRIVIKGLPGMKIRPRRPLPSSKKLKSLRLVRRPSGIYAVHGIRGRDGPTATHRQARWTGHGGNGAGYPIQWRTSATTRGIHGEGEGTPAQGCRCKEGEQ